MTPRYVIAVVGLFFALPMMTLDLEHDGSNNNFIICDNKEEDILVAYDEENQQLILSEQGSMRSIPVTVTQNQSIKLFGAYTLVPNTVITVTLMFPLEIAAGDFQATFLLNRSDPIVTQNNINTLISFYPQEIIMDCSSGDIEEEYALAL